MDLGCVPDNDRPVPRVSWSLFSMVLASFLASFAAHVTQSFHFRFLIWYRVISVKFVIFNSYISPLIIIMIYSYLLIHAGCTMELIHVSWEHSPLFKIHTLPCKYTCNSSWSLHPGVRLWRSSQEIPTKPNYWNWKTMRILFLKVCSQLGGHENIVIDEITKRFIN